MATPTGLIKFKGTLDGITIYYHKVYGWIARRKGGPDPKKMKTEKRFERVRENGKEFGACAKAAGLVRRGLLPFLKETASDTLTGRLIKVFTAIKKLDHISVRGKRTVREGLETKEGRALLEGFEFNLKAPVDTLLKTNYSVNAKAHMIRIDNFVTRKHVRAPKGATHVQLKLIVLSMDLKNGRTEVEQSSENRILLSTKSGTIQLKCPALKKQDCLIHILQVCFYQQMNGQEYQLQDKTHNGMKVLHVQ